MFKQEEQSWAVCAHMHTHIHPEAPIKIQYDIDGSPE